MSAPYSFLLPKAANPPFDAFSFLLEPEPLAHPEGIVIMGVMKACVNITLTAAQLKALPGAKTQVVLAPPAPPKGFGSALILVPTKMLLQFLIGTTAYTIANADNKFSVEYTGKAVSLIEAAATGLVDQAANTLVSVSALAAGNLAQTDAAGLGLEMSLIGTGPALTLGDGTLNVQLQFDVLVLR